jgi:hypothetical protein
VDPAEHRVSSLRAIAMVAIFFPRRWDPAAAALQARGPETAKSVTVKTN